MRPSVAAVFLTVGLLSAWARPTSDRAEPALGAAEPSVAGSPSGPEIPDRPEKLTFPPLQYEPPKPGDYRVPLQAGPMAIVVPDRELPLVNVTLYVRTGQYVEPKEKAGLASLAGHLLVRGGTESKSAEELEEKLDFLAAILNSGVWDTQGSVSLNLLSKDLEAGLALLREVLTTPRFQENKIKLAKDQTVSAMKQRNDDSADIEGREQGFLTFGESFWANRYTTEGSIGGLTREDLLAFHRRWFHPANFVVAASGDFDRASMVAKLEALFANWPFQGERAPAIPVDATFASPGAYLVDKDVNQGRVSVLLPGVLRDNPDYFAITVMNRILGGGGFTSRIMNRVRSDEGLAYSASSQFPGGVYYPVNFEAAFQTKSRTVAYATSIVLEEMKKIGADPVTDEELTTAKRSFIDTFPRGFGTKGQVASRFADDEFTGRYAKDPIYWQTYCDKIAAVTKDDIQRVARQYLVQNRVVVLVVGQKAEILKGHPDHPVQLPDLVGGKVIDVPLRDPLTMQPMQ